MEKNKHQVVGLINSVIFKKILLIFISLSIAPVILSSFLTFFTYQDVLNQLEKGTVFSVVQIEQLRQNIFVQVALLLFILVVLVVFFSILIANRVIRPLSALVQWTRLVSSGNFATQFSIKTKDEFEELSLSFNEMVEKLKEVDQAKTEFISIAAHQLRTPLSSIKWILKMMIDQDFGPLSVKQLDFANKAYASNEIMIQLVGDLLDISRLDEGRFVFAFAESDLGVSLQEVVESFVEPAKRKNIDLIYHAIKSPLKMFFDPVRLKMAFFNLIDNAIHYTHEGGTVEISVKIDREHVVVAVKDTGVGIPLAQQQRIFTKFFRGDNVIRMQTDGTGLGLYLAKNIVEKHGGKIWFESQEKKGTVFYVSLPFLN